MTITDQKTTHILFDADILYVDLGNTDIMADKVPGALNVLRIKATSPSVRPTNFTVITQKGEYYNFEVSYCDSPEILSYDFSNKQRTDPRQSDPRESSPILLSDFKGGSFSEILKVIKAVEESKVSMAYAIRSQSYGVGICVKGIFTHKDKLYFYVDLENFSNLDFQIQSAQFYVMPRRTKKGSTISRESLEILHKREPFITVSSKKSWSNIFVVQQFSLEKDKELLIEIKEKNGRRDQVISIRYERLLRARKIELKQ